MFNFIEFIFCIYWDGHVVLLFCSVNIVNYINWFLKVKPILYYWNKIHLMMVYHQVYELNFLNFCLKILLLCVWGVLIYSFLFCNILLLFCYQCNTCLNVLENVVYFFFLKYFAWNLFYFFLKFLIEVTSKAIWVWKLFWGRGDT